MNYIKEFYQRCQLCRGTGKIEEPGQTFTFPKKKDSPKIILIVCPRCNGTTMELYRKEVYTETKEEG